MGRLISSDEATINKRMWRLRNRFAILDILQRSGVLAVSRPFDLDEYVNWSMENYLDCYETGTRN